MKKVKQPTIFKDELKKWEEYNKEVDKSGYKPWINIRSSKTHGRAHQIFSPLTGRNHELLSDCEAFHFYMIERDSNVIDIFEQFPLNIAKTMKIAKELNIRHPQRYKDRVKYNNVLPATTMTTDILTLEKCGNQTKFVAHNFKYSKSLDKTRTSPVSVARTLLKIKLEQECWQEEGVEFKSVVIDRVNQPLMHNLFYLRTYSRLFDEFQISRDQELEVSECLYDIFNSFKEVSIKKAFNYVCAELKVNIQHVDAVFKKWAYDNAFLTECDQYIVLDKPLPSILVEGV